MSQEEHADIIKARKEGELNKAIAARYGVTPGAITRIWQKYLKKHTRFAISETAYVSSQKLREAVLAADPTDKEDRKFIADAFAKSADRDGLSPQAVAQTINNIGQAVIMQPILAASEFDGLRNLMRGNVVDVKPEEPEVEE
jgi:hypothetical protein